MSVRAPATASVVSMASGASVGNRSGAPSTVAPPASVGLPVAEHHPAAATAAGAAAAANSSEQPAGASG